MSRVEVSETEKLALSQAAKDPKTVNNVINLLVDYEDDPDGFEQALRDGLDADDEHAQKGACKFDPTLILILIKLAPLIWTAIQSLPNIIALIGFFRKAKQARRRRNRE